MGFDIKEFNRCIKNKKLADKLSFVVNYFNYTAYTFHENDTLLFETYLTLIDKIIFQIESNIDRSKEYILNYFQHELFNRNNPYFEQQKYYEEILRLINDYKERLTTNKEKAIFLQSNIDILKRYRTYLRKTLFNYAVKRIKEYIFCDNKVNREEITYQLEFIAATLYYANYSQEDLLKIMDRILFIKDFPLPNNIKKEEAENYLKKLDFASLFDGFKNLYRQKSERSYFLFKVENILSGESYFFNYNNQIKFYNTQHFIFNEIKQGLKKKNYGDFFNNPNDLIVVVKVDAINKQIAKQKAIKKINEAIDFLNTMLLEKQNANVYINPFYYIRTNDFKDSEISFHTSKKGTKISKLRHQFLLKANLFHKLNKIPQQAKRHLLENEYLYYKAELSKNPVDYWQYIETLFYPNKNISTIFSSILKKEAQNTYSEIFTKNISYIIDLSSDILASPSSYAELIHIAYSKNLPEIESKIKHPFVQFLLTKRKVNIKKIDTFYNDIILSCKSQRNAFIHSNMYNDIETVQLQLKFHLLFKRLRKIIINAIEENPDKTFEEIIELLKN